jgi:archaeosine synthase
MLETLARSGVGRVARWSSGKDAVSTPNIAFIDLNGGSLPPFGDLVLRLESGAAKVSARSTPGPSFSVPGGLFVPLSHLRLQDHLQPTVGENAVVVSGDAQSVREQVEGSDAEVYVLGNAFEMRRDARTFADAISALREAVGPTKLIYLPGIMDCSNLAVLAYLGADLFDSSLLHYQASRGKLSTIDGSLAAADAKWLVNDGKEPSVLAFNLEAAWKELQLVRHMTTIGRLRELAEIRAHATPWGVAALRLFDRDHYSLQEKYTAVVGPSFYCNTSQSLRRPDIVRWRGRLMARFRPAPHKKILLFIPCSAKKPYFTSKSHRAFHEVLESVPNAAVVQEMIVTSPLGLVPRELELFYPAAQYDIPVTGHWDREEAKMLRELVAKISSLGFEKVVVHLGKEGALLADVVSGAETVSGGPTSRDSLSNLAETLANLSSAYPRVPRMDERRESMASVARVQFGAAAPPLTEGVIIVGNYPYSRIMEGKVQLGMLTPERGMISLTLEGADKLLPQGINQVRIGDFDLTGNLFAVGVEQADENIRAGDEVLVVRKDRLVGVGVAAMCGEEMTASKKGEAVRIRHKRKYEAA